MCQTMLTSPIFMSKCHSWAISIVKSRIFQTVRRSLCKRANKTRFNEGLNRRPISNPQGLKPTALWLFSARLKSCPDTKRMLETGCKVHRYGANPSNTLKNAAIQIVASHRALHLSGAVVHAQAKATGAGDPAPVDKTHCRGSTTSGRSSLKPRAKINRPQLLWGLSFLFHFQCFVELKHMKSCLT